MAIYSDSNQYQHWRLVEFDLKQISFVVKVKAWTATGLTLSFTGSGYLPNAKHNLYVVNYNGLVPTVLPGLPTIQADQTGALAPNSVTIPSPPVTLQGFVIFILENEEGTGDLTGVIQGMTALTVNYFKPPPRPPFPYPP
jgi:hypothetical protein